MSTYRWNKTEFAAGYDAAAVFIHPLYETIQQQILSLLPQAPDDEFLLVDAGGGSGRLAALFLERFPRASAIVVDQSEAFLALAAARLARFGARGATLLARLQDDWPARLPTAPHAIVSMSAIHHLSPAEKQALYQKMHAALAPGGVLLNGDEVRPADDAAFLAELHAWSDHMRRMQDSGQIPAQMDEILDHWRHRNILEFGQPKQSGDDQQETIAAQLHYLRLAGFTTADCPWHEQMWAVIRGRSNR